MFYLRITGHIKPEKTREFQQTFKSIHVHPREGCEEFALSEDTLTDGLFHFSSIWQKKADLDHFLETEDYHMILSSFRILGMLTDQQQGEYNPNYR